MRKEVGIPQSLPPQAQGFFIGAVFVGLALAFGLGGKEAAGNLVANLSRQFSEGKKHA